MKKPYKQQTACDLYTYIYIIVKVKIIAVKSMSYTLTEKQDIKVVCI